MTTEEITSLVMDAEEEVVMVNVIRKINIPSNQRKLSNEILQKKTEKNFRSTRKKQRKVKNLR